MTNRCWNARIVHLVLLVAMLPSVPVRAQERLPPLSPEKMSEAQKKAAADYSKERPGAPVGPFAVLLRVPELMDLAVKWRQHVAGRPAIEPRLTEFGILVTARHWTQQYEWNAHYPAALKTGVKPDTIAAMAEGRRPAQMADDEAVLYDLLTELLQNHGVSDATYARALAKFGEAGVVEATSLAGYYAMLAMVMNTARTPLPQGAKLPLAAFPQ